MDTQAKLIPTFGAYPTFDTEIFVNNVWSTSVITVMFGSRDLDAGTSTLLIPISVQGSRWCGVVGMRNKQFFQCLIKK